MDEMSVLLSIAFWIAVAIILIYLIIRRIKIKESEDFEKRDN